MGKQKEEVHVSPASEALQRSLQRALRNQKRARKRLKTGPVHDFRVALRRSRTLAEGLSAIDPDPVWRRLRKTAKRLQGGMSDLRDTQVLESWLKPLRFTTGPVAKALHSYLKKQKRTAKRGARKIIKSFPRKRWKRWLRQLPEKAELIPASERRVAQLVLEQLTHVIDLHNGWTKEPNAQSWHKLRVAVKRFRYMVESFLPQKSGAWGAELERAQDLLGEGHDLDVLHGLVVKISRKKALPKGSVGQYLRRIDSEARKRREEYIAHVSERPHRSGQEAAIAEANTNRDMLWNRWRAQLEAMAEVNRRGAEAPAKSEPRLGLRAAARANRYPYRQRRISSAP
ncbi:MAG TPA: CHAD domain-containing protein [Candidatus Acidoferrales bacterium]|jgi:CHAD domain-containing protein|nr:CHAD domain-containing protein [Candidatus Acidoferrales bacterium]